MNGVRLERSLRLLRAVNSLRRDWHHVDKCGCGCQAVALAQEELAQHDSDGRARVDARQVTIWEALAKRQA